MALSIVEQVRTLLDDKNLSEQWKDDCDIEGALSLAVPIVAIECGGTYEMTGNTETSITPAPSGLVKALFAYKTAIILLTGTLTSVSRDGIMVRDGDITLDTTKGLEHRKGILDGLAAQYDRLLTAKNMNDSVNVVLGSRINMYYMGG